MATQKNILKDYYQILESLEDSTLSIKEDINDNLFDILKTKYWTDSISIKDLLLKKLCLEEKARSFYTKLLLARSKTKKLEPHYNEFIDKWVNWEKSFFLKIVDTISKAKEENPGKKIIVLFDLDETLVRNSQYNKEEWTLIRPSATIILDFINRIWEKAWILSSRSELKSQLETLLNPLKPFIDESYVFSSMTPRNAAYMRYEYSPKFIGFAFDGFDFSAPEEQKKISEERSSIDERIPDCFIGLKGSFWTGNYQKAALLDSIIVNSENNDKIFIPIDDAAYPSVFKYWILLKQNEVFNQ